MDRKFLEEHLSAFVDGELEPKQMREFEREIEHHPDLKAELQQLQKLNQFSRASKVSLPPDGYFDQLAERIDSRIRREVPETRSKFVEFILARRKTVAIVSSVAAVLLIVVIGVNMIGPNAKRYPDQIRSIEVTPAILNSPKSEADSVRLWPKRDQKIVPPPVVDSEISSTGESPASQTKGADDLKMKAAERKDMSAATKIVRGDEPAPSTQGRTEQVPARKAPLDYLVIRHDSIKAPGDISVPEHELFEAPPASRSIVFDKSTAVETLSVIVPEQRIQSQKKQNENLAYAPQALSELHKEDDTSSDLVQQLDSGVYPSRVVTGIIASRDSLKVWIDSSYVIDPALWHAEQSYRESLTQEPTDENFAQWKIYIEHYMSRTGGDALNKWRKRLDAIHEKYEISKGKIYEPGRPSNE